jgi:hypothetical protein
MNTRLKELMLEAGYAAPELAGRGQKLAELIVKECIEVVEKQKAKMSYGPTFVIEDIKQHFGVEE